MTFALAAALFALSARAALAPGAAALAYGVRLPDGEPTPYLEVKANRDFTLAALLVVIAFASPHLLSTGLFLGAVAPAADAWIVAHHGENAGDRGARRHGSFHDRRRRSRGIRTLTCYFAALLAGHLLAATTVAALFSLPFIAHAPRALHAVLVLLRFAAGLTLLSRSGLWIMLRPAHPAWLYLSLALFAIVIMMVMFIVSPAAARLPGDPETRRRVRWASVVSSALTIGIGVLIVLQPSWA